MAAQQCSSHRHKVLYSHANELLFVVAFVVLVPNKQSYKEVVTIVFVSLYIQTQKKAASFLLVPHLQQLVK